MQLSTDGRTLLRVENKDIQPDGSYFIPDGVTTIGKGAFDNCVNLIRIEIPSSVTTIGESAFANCENLATIKIPSSVTTIGQMAFFYCSNLRDLVIPASVTQLNFALFWSCTNLCNLMLPASLTQVDDGAFAECVNPKLTIIIASNKPEDITRITQLLPDFLKHTLNKAFQDLVNQVIHFCDKQLARLIKTPETSPLYRFFSYTDPNQERAIEKKYGYLPPELLCHINKHLVDDNPYYIKAQKAIEAIQCEPWPKTYDELKLHEEKVKKIVDEQIQMAITLNQPNVENVPEHTAARWPR